MAYRQALAVGSAEQLAAAHCLNERTQGVYNLNRANFQEIPGGILRKIQDILALLRPPM